MNFSVSLIKRHRLYDIQTERFFSYQMCITKIGKNVPSTIAGDDGEAMAESEKSSLSEVSVSVSEAIKSELVMPVDAGWYVAVVRCNCEKRIADSIKRIMDFKKLWFEYWVPMQKVWYIDKRTNKRKHKEKTFLTTFIFCHVSKRQLDEIRFRSDVYKMLTMPGHSEIYRIPDSVLCNYRHIVENPDLPVTPHTGQLKKGQRVRITEGYMAGVEAYVQRIRGNKAVIGNEIKYISGATIEIDRRFLEVVE